MTRDIVIRTTSSPGASVNTPFTLNIMPNTAPPTLALMASRPLTTGAHPGSLVGTLGTTDLNVGPCTYSILPGANSHLFLIDAQANLKTTGAILEQGLYLLNVQTVDGLGFASTQALQFMVQPSTTPPTVTTLSRSTVAAFLPAGTIVGTLSTTDPNYGVTESYSVLGLASRLFAVDVRGNLRTSVVFQNVAPTTFNLTIRTTNSLGLSLETPFDVTVNPGTVLLDVALCGTTVAAGLTIGTRSDPNDRRTYCSRLDTASGRFAIAADTLKETLSFRNATRTVFNLALHSPALPRLDELARTIAVPVFPTPNHSFAPYGLAICQPSGIWQVLQFSARTTFAASVRPEDTRSDLAFDKHFHFAGGRHVGSVIDTLAAPAEQLFTGSILSTTVHDAIVGTDSPTSLTSQRFTFKPGENVLRANTQLRVRGSTAFSVRTRTANVLGLTRAHFLTVTVNPVLRDVRTTSGRPEPIRTAIPPAPAIIVAAPADPSAVEQATTLSTPVAPDSAPPPPASSGTSTATVVVESSAPVPATPGTGLPWNQPEVYTVSMTSFVDDPTFHTSSVNVGSSPIDLAPRRAEIPADALFSSLTWQEQQKQFADDAVDLALWAVEVPETQTAQVRAAVDAQVFATLDIPGTGAWGLSVLGTAASLRASPKKD